MFIFKHIINWLNDVPRHGTSADTWDMPKPTAVPRLKTPANTYIFDFDSTSPRIRLVAAGTASGFHSDTLDAIWNEFYALNLIHHYQTGSEMSVALKAQHEALHTRLRLESDKLLTEKLQQDIKTFSADCQKRINDFKNPTATDFCIEPVLILDAKEEVVLQDQKQIGDSVCATCVSDIINFGIKLAKATEVEIKEQESKHIKPTLAQLVQQRENLKTWAELLTSQQELLQRNKTILKPFLQIKKNIMEALDLTAQFKISPGYFPLIPVFRLNNDVFVLADDQGVVPEGYAISPELREAMSDVKIIHSKLRATWDLLVDTRDEGECLVAEYKADRRTPISTLEPTLAKFRELQTTVNTLTNTLQEHVTLFNHEKEETLTRVKAQKVLNDEARKCVADMYLDRRNYAHNAFWARATKTRLGYDTIIVNYDEKNEPIRIPTYVHKMMLVADRLSEKRHPTKEDIKNFNTEIERIRRNAGGCLHSDFTNMFRVKRTPAEAVNYLKESVHKYTVSHSTSPSP